MSDFVFVYSRPGQRSVTQLPPCEKRDKVWFDDTYLDYIYAAVSLMRFVFLGIT